MFPCPMCQRTQGGAFLPHCVWFLRVTTASIFQTSSPAMSPSLSPFPSMSSNAPNVALNDSVASPRSLVSPRNRASASMVYASGGSIPPAGNLSISKPGARRIVSVRLPWPVAMGSSLAVIFPAAKVSSVAMIASRKRSNAKVPLLHTVQNYLNFL